MLILRSLSLCPFLLTLLNCNGFIRIPSMKTRNVILNAGAPDMNWDPNSAPKLNFDEDYYSVLEIPPECTPQELKKKYLKLVFQYHPDNKENEQSKNLANKQMMVINNAYKILKDSEKRAEYDRKKRIKDSYKESKSSTRNNKYSTSGSSSASTSSSSQQSKSTQQSNFNENFEYPPWAKAYSYGGNAAEEDEDSSSESMVDVLSDLFSELRKDGGQSVLRDFTEFLEEQMPERSVRSGRTALSVEIEIDVKTAAAKRIETHIQDLRAEKTALEASLLWMQMKQQTSPGMAANIDKQSVADELSKSLQCKESLKGVQARVTEAENQLRRLKKEIVNAELELKVREQTQSASSRNNNVDGEQQKTTQQTDQTNGSNRGDNSAGRNTSNTYRDGSSSSSGSSGSKASSAEVGGSGPRGSVGGTGTGSTSRGAVSDPVEEELRNLKKKMGLL